MPIHSRTSKRSAKDHRGSHPLGNPAMRYHKPCNRCGNLIFMTEINGKWSAFEDSMLSTHHTCNDIQTSITHSERIQSLEKIVRLLNDKIYLLQEKIDELSKRTT